MNTDLMYTYENNQWYFYTILLEFGFVPSMGDSSNIKLTLLTPPHFINHWPVILP